MSKKYKRGYPRAILTDLEKRYCKGEFVRDERHVRSHIILKSRIAIEEDLPLIFGVFHYDYFFWGNIFPAQSVRKFAKRTLGYLFQLERQNLSFERRQRKVKRTVKFQEAWRQVNKTIREAKKEIEEEDRRSKKQPT